MISRRQITSIAVIAVLLISAASAELAYPKNLQEFAESLAVIGTRTTVRPGTRTTYVRPATTYVRPATTYVRPGTTYVRPSTCPYNCFQRGKCVSGTCYCNSPFTGADCSLVRRHMSSKPNHNFWGCKSKCSGNGICFFGSCLCYKGFEGAECNKKASLEGADRPAKL